MVPITAPEFMKLWKNRGENNYFFIDARPLKASKKIEDEYPDWHAIPLDEVKARLGEIPHDRPIALICNTGHRAAAAQLLLANNGYKNTVNSMGGMQMATQMGFRP